MDLKSTINLPKTGFPMKAGLPQNEPKILARWEERRLYDRIREARQGAPTYVLHDGPPFTSGPIHLGTAMNKCLKDFIVKSKTMAGFDSPYVPGWDCHGLPIEIKVDNDLGMKKASMSAIEIRAACRPCWPGLPAGGRPIPKRLEPEACGDVGSHATPMATRNQPPRADSKLA